jgi:hypothetical protein
MKKTKTGLHIQTRKNRIEVLTRKRVRTTRTKTDKTQEHI